MAATDPPRRNQQRPLANHPPQQQINRTNSQEHHGGLVAQRGRSTQQGGWGAHGGRVDHRDQSSRGAHGGWDAPPNQGGHGALPSYRNNKGGRPGFGQRPQGRNFRPGFQGHGRDEQPRRDAGNQGVPVHQALTESTGKQDIQAGRGETAALSSKNSVEVTMAKAKKPRPVHCFRCKGSGHLLDGCKTVLDCFICNKKDAHVPNRCPILKEPKPTAALFGFSEQNMGFLRIQEFDMKLEPPKPAPTALVTILDGHLAASAVQNELARLIRADWNWKAVPHGDNSYLVTFPSEEELNRMDDVEFRLKNHGVSITIQQWQQDSDIIPVYQLDEVWVHITGVPHSWRHYLCFWALGTVVGTTQEVDMLTFRKKGIIRIKVGVLSRADLPIKTDIVFGKIGYHEPIGGGDEDVEEGGDSKEDNNTNHIVKKHKSSSSTTTQTDQGSGPMPMQLALTPFGPLKSSPSCRPVVMDLVGLQLQHPDVSQEISPAGISPPATPRSVGPENIRMNAAEVQEIEAVPRTLSATEIQSNRKQHAVPVAHPISKQQNPSPGLMDGHLSMPLVKKCSVGSTVAPFGSTSKVRMGTVSAPLSSQQMTQGNYEEWLVLSSPGDCNGLRRSGRSNAEQISGIAMTDDDSLSKAMRQKAICNLDGPVKE
ncbi:hypothetical protein DAI22_03g235100 [Oryza sativa Japonica Group]|nr:hypothetical protein DAI22_03g235100 [Oryza sativa Japonica Group]